MKRRNPRVGDWVIITNPWGDNWKGCGVTKEDRKAVMGMVGKIRKIYKNNKSFSELDLNYLIDIASSKDKIRKLMPSFEGVVWNRIEFEVIYDKSKVFTELI